jgi:hypothetical protein
MKNKTTGFSNLVFLFIILSVIWIIPSDAVRVQRLTLTEIRERAERIILGVVVSSSTRLTDDGDMVWTDYKVEVEETLQGETDQAFETLSVAGGSIGGIDVGIAGVPHFKVGSRYVFFLLPRRNYVVPTVGWGQGIFEVLTLNVSEKGDKQILISYDNEPLEITNGGLKRGLHVYKQGGRLFPMPDQRQGTTDEQKEEEPVILDAAGIEIDQHQIEPEQVTKSLSERTFSTLNDLRLFINGELNEVPPDKQ